MDFSFVNTLWFKIVVAFIFLIIYTVIILKEEDKAKEKKNEM